MNTTSSLKLALAILAAALPLGAQDADAEHGRPEVVHHRLNDQAQATIAYAPTVGSTSALSRRQQLTYHGGPVFSTPTAYIIWYGSWSQNNGTDTSSGQQIIRDFFSAIGGSPYFMINSHYVGSSNAISGNVTWSGKEYNAGYAYGTALSDSNIQSIVRDAINSGQLGFGDTNGIYFVMTSSDVNESSGFCTQYCGWHTHGTINGLDIKYSFVGNAARCITSCAEQSTSPNGNAGVDGMISVTAHELEEATTDADLNAWYARTGAENGDDCAWTFGTSYQVANGSWANMRLGNRDFLIQRNVDFRSTGGQYCDLAHH